MQRPWINYVNSFFRLQDLKDLELVTSHQY